MISKFRLWCLPVFLLTAHACLAEAPSGLIRFTAEELNTPVYDFSGGYIFEQAIITQDTELPLDTSFAVHHDAKGKLTGRDTSIVRIGEDFVGASYVVSGRAIGSRGITRVLMTVRMEGVGVVAGVNTRFSIKLNYNLRVTDDPELGGVVLKGSVSGRVSFSDLGSGKVKSAVVTDLPGDTDGDWELWMNVVTLGRVSGSGYVYIPAKDRTLPGNVKGSYKASRDLSKVSFKGTGEARGTTLSTRFYTQLDEEGIQFHTLERVKGRVLGQRVVLQ